MRVQRAMILCLCLAATTVSLVACEDEAAQQRRELQETVSSASATLRDASLIVIDPTNEQQFSQTREQLQRVVDQLRSADTSQKTGQEAAINSLLADAGQKLAAMHLAELEHAVSQLRDDSAAARSRVSAILRLSEFAAATEQIDISDETAELDSARSGASTQLSRISDLLAQLDEPIATLSNQNRDDVQRINELRQDAEQLVNRARQLGPAEGFPQYEQALNMQREAGTIETDIARREIDLAYEYEPQQQIADTQARQLQQYIQTLDQAEQNLRAIVDAMSTEVSRTNQQISTLRSELADRLDTIEDTISGPIETAYEQGIAAAEQAMQAARRGASGDSARLQQAQLLETTGRLNWARARVRAQQINLLERVVDAGSALGSTSNVPQMLSRAREVYDQSVQAATQAYTEAQASLPAKNTTETQRLQRSLELAISTISGSAAPDNSRTPPTDDRSAMQDDSTAGSGYESPQALLAALHSIDPMRPETSTVLIDAVQTTTPLQVQFVDAIYEVNEASTRMNNAVIENLGRSVAESLARMGAAATPDFATATIVDEDSENATLQAQMMQGSMTASFELVRTEDGWKVDFDSFQTQMTSANMSISDSISFLRAMARVFDDLADRINAGEITSEQLMTAFQQAMMNAAGN